MTRRIRLLNLPLAALLALLAVSASTRAGAEEAKGKLRISFGPSWVSISDEIRSNANNTANFIRPNGSVGSTSDPREDRAAESHATIEDDFQFGVNVNYGLIGWKWGELVLEGQYNYFESTIDDLEVSFQALFENPDMPGTPAARERGNILRKPDCIENFRKPCFSTTRFEVGDIEWHNPQIGAVMRLRPSKRFSPYFGAGVGYFLVDFSMSSELALLSTNLENSSGEMPILNPKNGQIKRTKLLDSLGPIVVDAPDSFEYHGIAGMEWSLSPKWTFFADSRYIVATDEVTITTAGFEEFGTPVPSGTQDSEITEADLSVRIPIGQGGAIDRGRAVRDLNSGNGTGYKKAGTDGIPDPGAIYVQGGTIDYGGLTVTFGARYTF